MKAFPLVIAGLLTIALLGAFAFSQARIDDGGDDDAPMVLYKSPSCSCCGGYVDYLKRAGMGVSVHNVADMQPVKQEHGIPGVFQSCHTAVVGGYAVEGHVPLEAIEKLLEERPDVDAIALPGMPQGAPGMGGVQTGPFVVYALDDGEAWEFTRI